MADIEDLEKRRDDLENLREMITGIPELRVGGRACGREVPLTPDLQAKLSRLAVQQGRTEALVVEAVERLVSYDEWFLRECRRAWRPPIAENSWITMKSES